MANYIELKALRQLDYQKYLNSIENIKSKILNISNLIPIRNISYDIGALFLIICDNNNISFEHNLGETNKTIYELLSEKIDYAEIFCKPNPNLKSLIKEYYQENENIVKEFLIKKQCKIKGEYLLAGFDPMNTIKINNYLYCKHFIAYFEDEKIKFLQEKCLVKINDEFKILEIYY